jgi:hypothetical protein
MGTTLSGLKIKDTYQGLIKLTDNAAASGSTKELTDGVGNDLNIQVDTTGRLEATSFVKTGGSSSQILLANGTVATSLSSGFLANDSVTHDKLENRYTAKATSTSTGSQNLDASAATTFLLTGNVATATLTIQNMKLGQVIDIVLSGTLSSAVITLATDFTSATINKVGSTALDQSATNVIQVVCVDDTDSAAILIYSINTYAVDTTP